MIKHTDLKNNIAVVSVSALLVGLCLGFVLGQVSDRDRGTNMMDMSHGNMQEAMNGMTAGLSGKTGDGFDNAFLSEMIVHHQGAVDMAREVIQKSKRPELIDLARGIIAAQTKEITMMQNWKKIWFGQ